MSPETARNYINHIHRTSKYFFSGKLQICLMDEHRVFELGRYQGVVVYMLSN